MQCGLEYRQEAEIARCRTLIGSVVRAQGWLGRGLHRASRFPVYLLRWSRTLMGLPLTSQYLPSLAGFRQRPTVFVGGNLASSPRWSRTIRFGPALLVPVVGALSPKRGQFAPMHCNLPLRGGETLIFPLAFIAPGPPPLRASACCVGISVTTQAASTAAAVVNKHELSFGTRIVTAFSFFAASTTSTRLRLPTRHAPMQHGSETSSDEANSRCEASAARQSIG
jgi:hypothetical protein